MNFTLHENEGIELEGEIDGIKVGNMEGSASKFTSDDGLGLWFCSLFGLDTDGPSVWYTCGIEEGLGAQKSSPFSLRAPGVNYILPA